MDKITKRAKIQKFTLLSIGIICYIISFRIFTGIGAELDESLTAKHLSAFGQAFLLIMIGSILIVLAFYLYYQNKNEK